MDFASNSATIRHRVRSERVNDENKTWRLIYRIDADALIIVEVFEKKTQKTPRQIIANTQLREKEYES